MEMSADLINRYRRWFEYEKDSHAKVFASFETVAPASRSNAEYRKAVALMAHLVFARRMWLFRMGLTDAPAGSPFPEDTDLAKIAAEWEVVSTLWSDYLARSTDADLDRTVEYQSLDAGRYRNRIEDILTQLFGHSWYHRGQIATLIRLAGGEPAATDLVYWCRESIGQA